MLIVVATTATSPVSVEYIVIYSPEDQPWICYGACGDELQLDRERNAAYEAITVKDD